MDSDPISANQDLIEGLTSPGLFKPPTDVHTVLSEGIDWLSWKKPRKILRTTRGQFRTGVERKVMKDLILHLKSNFEGLSTPCQYPITGT